MSNLLRKHELAELVGTSERTIRRRFAAAKVEGEIGSNGQPEALYDVADLPAEIQEKWARAARRKVVEMTPAAPASIAEAGQLALSLTAPQGPNLSGEDRAEAARRFEVIEPLVAAEKYPLLYAQYPKRADLMEYLAKAHGKPVRTIYRWLGAWQQGGLPALVRRDRSDKGKSRAMNDAARAFLLKLSVPQKGMYGALRIAEMWRVYEEERAWRDRHLARPLTTAFDQGKYGSYLDAENRLTPAAMLPAISYETFRVWFNRIPEMIREMGREGNEAYRNTQEIISHRDIAAVQPMDYVVMDHRRLDIFCLFKERGGWKLARPWLTAAIDMRTRMWLAWAIVETPSSDSIATCLKRMFLNYGLPGALYWDNGKDFRCEWFEGRKRREQTAARIADLDPTWRGVLGTLGIRVHHAIVRNARAKLIEPNFGRVSGIDRAQPEWCGHQPGARPERFDDLVRQHERWVKGEATATPFRTAEEIAGLYSAAMRDLNERPLEGDGMRKPTPSGWSWYAPAEAWELLIGQVERRSVPADVLHHCFARRKELKVQHGEVAMTLNSRPYWYRLADNSLRLMALNGKTVELAYDPLDLGEAAVYFEGRFFGLVRCVELRRMGEEGFVQDERDRRAARRETLSAIRAVSRMAPGTSYEERLSRRQEILPTRAEVRVEIPAELPAPVVEATEAARAERAPVVESADLPREERGGDDDVTFEFFS